MIKDIIEEQGEYINACPFVQAYLKSQADKSVVPLSDMEQTDVMTDTKLEDWIDSVDVMNALHVSSRTLQTLRSNGTLPYSKLNGKIFYRRQDLERILLDRNTMYRLKNGYGKFRK